MVKAIIIGMVGLAVSVILMMAAYAPVPRKAEVASYDVYIPKNCKADFTTWSKGHQQFVSQVNDFVRMRHVIEACGGYVEETRKN